MITVLLADDHPLIRKGFRLVLDAESDITVAGEAGDGATAVSMCSALRPDVVLMDVRMPGRNGIEATGDIVAAGLPTRVLILTTFDLDDYVYAGLRAGASGFLLKDAQPDELLAAIRAVAAGDAVIAPAMTRRLLRTFTRQQLPRHDAADARVAELTAREREILTAIATGLTNAEIAERFVVSESTVKTHVGRILSKLGVRDRVGAVIVAYDAGLVNPAQ
jgi:DNA-binding NarL/FixJ family response regulator